MSKLYLFTQKGCVNCPVAKARLLENNIAFEEVDVNDISLDLTRELLYNNIVLYMTPSLVIEEDGYYRKISIEEILK